MRVRPANSKFARWLSRNSRFYRDSHRGGLVAPVRVTAEELPEVPVQIVGQSYLGAQAYACAYAAVLADAGFSATSDSWMS
ncbi:hypothetical protein [Streptosporangium sp. NPDC048865]|uniref:hypothetical protein n=1 Tax=Streptosporangium sp. NPDC048865 TaxID=3155766 RepID=UPI003434AFCB